MFSFDYQTIWWTKSKIPLELNKILSPNRAHLDMWLYDILYEVLHEVRGVIHHNCE